MSEMIVPPYIFDAFIEAIADRVVEKMEQRNPLPEQLPDNTTFDLEQAAEYLNCSIDFVRRKIKSGEIHGFKKGKWFVYKREIDRWIENGGSA